MSKYECEDLLEVSLVFIADIGHYVQYRLVCVQDTGGSGVSNCVSLAHRSQVTG